MSQYKSVFISDLHLGDKRCQSEKVVAFLNSLECDNLFLVGDIIDGWTLSKRPEWKENHSRILRKILKLSYKTKVRYIVGNHDDFIKPFLKKTFSFGNISFHRDYKYCTKNGAFLIVHGDQYDPYMWIPSFIWNLFPKTKTLVRYSQKICTSEYWIRKIALPKYDGVICGHSHEPKIEGGYMNCGDWTKSCTYIVEHYDGTFELKEYKD